MGSPTEPDWRAALAQLDGAYAAQTVRSYGADLRLYEHWCREVGLPLFGSQETLLRFLADRLEGLAPETIKRKIASLRLIHRLLGLADPFAAMTLKLALRRSLRRSGRRKGQALGLSAPLRDRLIGACPETPKGLRDRALIAVGYDVLARRSELVSLRIEDLVVLPRGAKILIRTAKTDPMSEGRFAYLSAGALVRLQVWLEKAGIRSGPLFRPVLNNRPLPRPMHPCGVNRALKAAAEQAGLEAGIVRGLSGHSMRVGAAQDLVVAGRSILQIMTAGRWTSLTVLGSYARAADLNLWEAEG